MRRIQLLEMKCDRTDLDFYVEDNIRQETGSVEKFITAIKKKILKWYDNVCWLFCKHT